MPPPPLNPRRLIQPDARTSLPPDKLLELTDQLVNDETLALRIAGMDGATVPRRDGLLRPKNSTSGQIFSATPGRWNYAPLRRWNICG